MPWQCPSVRLSVRVFQTFFQHALGYQFETWYIHSVGATTCRVWVSSQFGHYDLVYSQNEIKLIFFCNHGWPHKSRWILQIWYIGGPLYTFFFFFFFIVHRKRIHRAHIRHNLIQATHCYVNTYHNGYTIHVLPNFLYIHIYIHTYIHTLMYRHLHVSTYTYTHTYIFKPEVFF